MFWSVESKRVVIPIQLLIRDSAARRNFQSVPSELKFTAVGAGKRCGAIILFPAYIRRDRLRSTRSAIRAVRSPAVRPRAALVPRKSPPIRRRPRRAHAGPHSHRRRAGATPPRAGPPRRHKIRRSPFRSTDDDGPPSGAGERPLPRAAEFRQASGSDDIAQCARRRRCGGVGRRTRSCLFLRVFIYSSPTVHFFFCPVFSAFFGCGGGGVVRTRSRGDPERSSPRVDATAAAVAPSPVKSSAPFSTRITRTARPPPPPAQLFSQQYYHRGGTITTTRIVQSFSLRFFFLFFLSSSFLIGFFSSSFFVPESWRLCCCRRRRRRFRCPHPVPRPRFWYGSPNGP